MTNEPIGAGTPSKVTPNLDSVRGLACLLVVALHVVGDLPTNGLQLPASSGWHYTMDSIEFLRMPLFTAMSGYLYAGRRVTKGEFPRFWAKKFRRLVIPLIFVTLVTWLLREEASYRDPTTIYDALFFSFGHLWYIQAIIVIFLTVSAWDAWHRPSTPALVVAGLAAILVCQSDLPVTEFFSFRHALYIGPYFLFGMLLREHETWLHDRAWGTAALLIVLMVMTAQQLGMNGLGNELTLFELSTAIAGMAGVVFLLQRMPSNKLLAAIGVYSYPIYLWHIAASAALRTVLLKAGVDITVVLFVCCFVAAIVVPIVMTRIARHIPLLCVAVTGENRTPYATAKFARA
jgi:glucans biosynthesis protein C